MRGAGKRFETPPAENLEARVSKVHGLARAFLHIETNSAAVFISCNFISSDYFLEIV